MSVGSMTRISVSEVSVCDTDSCVHIKEEHIVITTLSESL